MWTDPFLIGTRTAWTCYLDINNCYYAARYWYDGAYVANAREDVAEVALQYLQYNRTYMGRMGCLSSRSSAY